MTEDRNHCKVWMQSEQTSIYRRRQIDVKRKKIMNSNELNKTRNASLLRQLSRLRRVLGLGNLLNT